MKDSNDIILVLGGSSSGKSDFAEALTMDAQKKYYLATMEKPNKRNAYYDEINERIMRHRKNREGKGFITLEMERDIEERIEKEIEEGTDAVLLESLSNLLSNEMFRDGIIVNEKDCEKKIKNAILLLSKKARRLVIVSDEIFSDGGSYDETTKAYLSCLAALHRLLANKAVSVYEVYYGIGRRLK